MTGPDLPPLRDVIAAHGLGAKKSLGQHFLLDLNLTAKVARAGGVGAGDRVVEVGPGPGGLTRALLAAGAEVVAIERDARCMAALADLEAAYPDRLTAVDADALTVDVGDLGLARPIKIVANLPYNIATELLVGWLLANHKPPRPLWSAMALMFQREVADRILAEPGTKAYGRLSVIAQAAARPHRAFNLPASAFTPPPKVASSVVSFAPAPERLDRLDRLETVTRAAFAQRRKMLRTSLKPVFGDRLITVLQAADLRDDQRAETVSVDQFVRLARQIDAGPPAGPRASTP
ncbi:MAG: 16S rRNA (adenine(1518)-N(6)/adenine(1519)-N(6))-dimethyltransferase RsmA [Pseudomonadota bacterium]